jgi:hypothetical protein
LAAAAPDVDWYSDLKDPVVDLVIAIAESEFSRGAPAHRRPST